jgi:uncharacterized protein
MTRSPFHQGEQAVQSILGVRAQAERGGQAMVRQEMLVQHQELFEKLPYIVIATVNHDQQPFATMLFGPPGLVQCPNSRTLTIAATLADGDPAADGVVIGAHVGVLGIELATRRRNRANGVICDIAGDTIVIDIQESFGNCPQYIAARAMASNHTPAHSHARSFSPQGNLLSLDAIALLERTDTMFIASHAGHGSQRSDDQSDLANRVDVSHRGGRPGFVKVHNLDGRTTLTIPDYTGNHMFMTLGNLHQNPSAGLSMIDFSTGSMLSLTGTTEIIWSEFDPLQFPGAERLIKFSVVAGALCQGAIPSSWTNPVPAKQFTSRET